MAGVPQNGGRGPLLEPHTQAACYAKQMQPPQLLLLNVRLPLHPLSLPPADAVAVSHGRIVAVGRGEDLKALAGPETHTLSLDGATLLPGFHDAHCHVLGFGQMLTMTPLSGVKTVPEIIQRLQGRAAEQNAGVGAWVRGRGYDQNVLAERRHPTRQDLDLVAGGLPYVLITHASGHAVSVNSHVLALAGITRDTLDPPGGVIVRGGQGEPTGVLLETAANLAYAAVPTPTQAEKVDALRSGTRALNALGITSAVDATMGVAASDSLADVDVYRAAEAAGGLSVRCTLMMSLGQLTATDAVASPNDLGPETDFVRLGPAKVFTDGALTTRTALLRSRFVDTEGLGTAVWGADALNDMVARAHGAGWQIAAHAIGDGAIDLCLDAYGKALARDPRPDARHRIEHAMLLWPDQVGRMARLGILPVYQPEFIARFGDAYRSGLGEVRAHRLMPYAETQAAGLPLVFSSDLPVVPGAPLDGIRSACARRTPSGEVLGARHRVSVLDGLRAYTEGAAYSVFSEGDRGRIAPGQRADFVVLNSDPLALPPDEWADGLTVWATMVGGKVVCGAL